MVKACSEAYKVSERSVRNWRSANDPRWLEFKVTYRRRNGGPAEETPGAAEPSQDLELLDDGLGEGIEAEIARGKRECKRLALMAHSMERRGDLDAAAGVHRILDAKRDNLRKLAGDNPDILAKAGDLVPRVLVLQYAATIRSMLDALPARLISIMPDDVRERVRDLISTEVSAIFRAAESVELDQAA